MKKRAEGLASRARVFKETVPCTVGLFMSLFLLAQTSAGQPADQDPADSAQTAQFTDDGIDACLLCHNVDRMRVISKPPHGKKDDPHTPFAKQGCESCHGPGSQHVTRLRRGKHRPGMIDYGKDAATPAMQQSETCLDRCHAEKLGEVEGMEWEGSTHAIAVMEAKDGTKQRVACSACHQMHAAEDPVKDKQKQAEACYACHEKTRKEHPRFEDKAINFDKLSCWTCHDVHQLIPEKETLAGNDANPEANNANAEAE
jgi:DmsE family decaheme c-type cytochrome